MGSHYYDKTNEVIIEWHYSSWCTIETIITYISSRSWRTRGSRFCRKTTRRFYRRRGQYKWQWLVYVVHNKKSWRPDLGNLGCILDWIHCALHIRDWMPSSWGGTMESFLRCQVSCFLSVALERGLGLARETWLFRLQAKKQRAPANDSILYYSIHGGGA